MPSRPASSPSASPRPAAPARCSPNGSRRARRNGTCGPAIRAASPPSPPNRTIASPRAWKSTATNTRCSSRAMPGRPGATGSSRRSMTASRRSARSSTPTMAGSAPPGTPSRATTHRRSRPRPVSARRPMGETHPRGMPRRARRRRHSRPARLLALPASRARRARLAVHLITGVVPKPGRIGLGYFADDKGRIVTEMSIMALEEDFFFLITAAMAQWHDFEWLQKHLPQGRGIHAGRRDRELHLPDSVRAESREDSRRGLPTPICRCLADAPVDQIAGRWCQLVRVSFAGELGWEIHTKVDDTAAIFDAVWAAGQKHGLKPFGMVALDSLAHRKGLSRLEGRSLDRLHHPAGRARALRRMGQARLQGQGGAGAARSSRA